MGILRTSLALAVVVSHIHLDPDARVGFSGAAIVAVRLFFLMSGFYMAFVLHEKYQGRTAAFYWARAVRLYPVYWVTLVATLAFAAVANPATQFLLLLTSNISTASPLDFLVATVANLSFLGLDLGYFFVSLKCPGAGLWEEWLPFRRLGR
jgi:peptidoglycan/LPS O-acetylase OafA/YrhL